MFIAIVINAIPRAPRRFTVADASFAHAAILSALTQVDEASGRNLHDAARHKVFSCAILPSAQPIARIRLVFHSQASASFHQSLLTALYQSPILRLGRTICDIQDIEVTPSEWSGVASWSDLLSGPVSSHISLQFVTPTAFMKTDGSNRRYSWLFPVPADVFIGLQRRWTSLGGPELAADLIDLLKDAHCIATEYQLQTSAFQALERLQIGFCGSATYLLHQSSPEFIQSMCALARFAHYTGVGYQTARGMGLVRSHIEY